MISKSAIIKLHPYIFLTFIITLFSSCGENTKVEQLDDDDTRTHELPKTPIEKVTYALGFDIEVVNNIKKLHIKNPFSEHKIEHTYVLLKKGQSYSPQGNETIINVPVKTIAPMSTTFYTAIEELNQLNSIVAISNSNIVFSSSIQHGYASGEIAQIGDGEQLNIEKLILLYPDVVVASGYQGGLSKTFLQAQEAGIPIILNYDWKETSPLARAEWIKFFGALYNQEEMADSIFHQIETNYDNYCAALDSISDKPNVLFSSSYQGTWYIPGGESYVAQLLKDAKGTYPWSSDSTTGSLPLSMEVVANKMLDADIWISSQSHSLEDLKQKDIRYTAFRPYKEGNVFEHDRRRTKAGGDDFWELGALRVDILLKDYINILHPNVLEDQSLTFFRKLD